MSWFLPDTNALFLHVPRTGGGYVMDQIMKLSIEYEDYKFAFTLRHRSPKHTLLAHMDQAKLVPVKYVFAFVRHPVSYYESMWRWITRNKRLKSSMGQLRKWTWHWNKEAISHYSHDFAEWAETMMDVSPMWVSRMFEQYVGPHGGELCDFIGRTETVREDLHQVLNHLGYGVELSDLGKGARHATRKAIVPRVAWPESLREEVERDERLAIGRFYGPETAGLRHYRKGTAFRWNGRRLERAG